MLLSSTDIFEALDDGRLVLDPQPVPRVPIKSNPDNPYDATAVNLRLGNIISLPIHSDSIIDFRKPKDVRETLAPVYINKKISSESPYILDPHKFILATTLENVGLPTVRKPAWGTKPLLAAKVEGKSTFARLGLLVHFTAPTIHCGYFGPITLEIMCLGPRPIVLVPSIPICQLLVEEVASDPSQANIT